MSFANIYNAQKNMSDFLINIYQNKGIILHKAEDHIQIQINTKNIKNPNWRNYLHQIEKDQINVLMSLYLTSRVFGAGPKVYEPSSIMLESMEAIDLNIKVSDYEQPFPTMVIEYPENYIKLAYDPVRNKNHKVDFIIIDNLPGIIIIGVHFNTNNLDESQIFTFPIYEDRKNVLIEDFFTPEGKVRYKSSLPVDPSEEEMAYITSRAAMNCCMSLIEYGMKKIGYKNPSYANRLQDRIKRKVRVDENQKELNELPVYYTLSQNVKLYDIKSEEHKSNSHGLINKVKPHWRQGHRRRQHYGLRNEQIKIITIKPVLINSELFLGQLSDTEYKLHG